MGFNIKTAELLIYSKNQGVDFTSVITIGRQRLHGYKYLFKKLFEAKCFPKDSYEKIFHVNNRYGEGFLEILGAKRIESLDASDYESASIIHDMNLPISDIHRSTYSTVIDSGSLEHIFNFPQAIKNCMQMVCKGGHFIGVTPTNNFSGHGFYQFSPELFFRIFTIENGFKLKKIFLFFPELNSPIYEISDPLMINGRVNLKNSKESFLFIIAEKIAEEDVFKIFPQQSDYENLVWNMETGYENKENRESYLSIFKSILPSFFVFFLLRLKSIINSIKFFTSPYGIGNKKYFKKIRLD